MEIEGPLIFSYLKLSMPFLSFFFHLPGIWFGVDYQRSHHFQEAYIEWVKAKRKISKISFYSCVVHALNGDYSTESAHKRFLFTSYDASKKKKTNKWAKRSVENFVASQPVNKNRSNAFHMVWCFSFHAYWDFFTFQYKDWKRTTVEIHRFPSFDISGSAVDDNFYLIGNFKIPNQLISVVKTSVTLKSWLLPVFSNKESKLCFIFYCC